MDETHDAVVRGIAPQGAVTRNALQRAFASFARVGIVALLALAPGGASVVLALAADAAECPALLRYTFNGLQTGKPQSLCDFRGKVLVIVNTASYCGYTKQYEGLEALY